MIYTFTQVIEHIQEVNEAIDGVTSAPTTLPASLNSSDLPCALCFVDSFYGAHQAIGMARRDTVYRVNVFVKPLVQGAGLDEGYQEMLTLAQAFITQYHTEQEAGGFFDDYVEQFNDFDGDLRPLEYAGVAYHGFTIRLRVVEK